MSNQGNPAIAIRQQSPTYFQGGLSVKKYATTPNQYSIDPITGDSIIINLWIDSATNYLMGRDKLNIPYKIVNFDTLAAKFYSKQQIDSIQGIYYNKSTHYTDSLVAAQIVNSSFGGSVVPTSNPAPSVNTYYFATQAGTYTNMGGVVVSANSFAIISYKATGAVWSISQTTFNLSGYTPNGGYLGTTDSINKQINQTSVNYPAYTYGPTLATPTLSTTPDFCFTQKGYTIPNNGTIDLVNVNATGTGTLYAIVLRLSGSNYVEVSRTNLSVVNGNNAISVSIPVLAGDKMGLGNSNTIVARYTNGGTKYSAVNIASSPATFTQTNLDDPTSGSNGILGFNFHLAAVNITAGLRQQIGQKADTTYVNALNAANLKTANLIINTGKNKFDKATMILPNKLVDNTGALITISGAKACRIPVVAGTQYAFFMSKYIANQGGQIRLVDASLNLVSTFAGTTLTADGTNTGKVITIPSTVAYIEFNIYYAPTSYADITDSLQFEIGNYRSAYSSCIQTFGGVNGYKIPETSSTTSIPYYNLNTVFFGTSITWLSPPNSYLAHVLERVSFKSVTNLAQSGATWSHTSTTAYDTGSIGGVIAPNNVIWNQFNKLKAAIAMHLVDTPDLIIIEGSINDVSAGRPVGSVSTTFAPGSSIIGNAPNTILSVTDAIRYDCELILQQWPNVQIIFMTPFQRGVSDNATVRDMGDTIEACGNRLSIDVIRQDKLVGIYNYNELGSTHTFLYDNLHPNAAGALKVGKKIAAELIDKIAK